MAIKAGWEPAGGESGGHPGHHRGATNQRGLATATAADDRLSLTPAEEHPLYPRPVLIRRSGCSVGRGAVAGRAAGVTVPLPSRGRSWGIAPAHQRVTLFKNSPPRAAVPRAAHGWACCVILRGSRLAAGAPLVPRAVS